MNVLPTFDDIKGKKTCATCTRKGGACARSEKRFPNGYVRNSVTGEIGGIIAGCPNWTGKI